jgi:hypothetical protein
MGNNIDSTKIGGHFLRELSVAVPCDPRTLKKALSGGRVSTLRMVAIKRALSAKGLLHLLPMEAR